MNNNRWSVEAGKRMTCGRLLGISLAGAVLVVLLLFLYR
jgi:hypothetical protein